MDEQRSDGEATITDLLLAWGGGETGARDQLMERLYRALRRMAGGQLKGERKDHSRDATALVHEASLRRLEQTRVRWVDRRHFQAVAARVMRRVLVDHARARSASSARSDCP